MRPSQTRGQKVKRMEKSKDRENGEQKGNVKSFKKKGKRERGRKTITKT